MAADSREQKILQEVLNEHVVLKQLLARIEQALQERQASVDEVGRLLGELGDRLIKHFTLEEDGGYFADALRHSPQLFERANALMAQHPKISRQVRELTQLGTLEQPDWWQETAARFQAFKEELFRHERAEDALIQDAYHQDIGSHD